MFNFFSKISPKLILVLISLSFFFFFATQSSQKVDAGYCSCTPNAMCATNSVSIGTGANGVGSSFYVDYSYCSADCLSCGATSNNLSEAGACPSNMPSNSIFGTGQASCPQYFSCNWSPTNASCPSGYAVYNGETCSVVGSWNETYNVAVCTPSSSGGGGGGGGSTCTTNSYYECETSSSGACGYLYTQYGSPAFDYVQYNSCTGYTCNDQQKPCDNTISGHVFIDYNRNGIQDAGEPNATTATATQVTIPYGTSNWTATTDSNGNYVIGNGKTTSAYAQLIGGTWTVQVTSVPTGYVSTTGSKSVSVSYSSLNPSNINFGIAPQQYTVSGSIFTDYNHDGSWNGNDGIYTASAVTVNAINSSGAVAASTTTSSGNYSLTLNWGDTYTIQIVSPSGYQQTTTNPTINLTTTSASNQTGQNFGITPLYQISGNIFNDVDQSHCYNPSTFGCTYQGYSNPPGSDTLFTNGSHLKITGTTTGTISTTADASGGVYQTSQTLPSGTYTVSYDTGTTPLPSGYKFVGPSTWQVVVGDTSGSPTCSTGSSPDAKCGNPNNGSISNLNIGVSNENAWQQPICSDARYNSGYSQPIPSTATCGGTSAPYAIYCPAAQNNVLFSGNTNPNYGQGTGASTSNYQVGNFSFPESYNYQIPNTSATSYSFVNTSLNTYTGTTTPLKNICPSLSSCVLSEATPGGVYTTTSADGPVSISISNVDGSYQLGKANYVFLIGGNLTFTSNVITQNGYSTTFISGGDIHVAGNVGESSWTSTNPDLEGFFSANNNFDIDAAYPVGQQCQANGQPLEKKLNIMGSVITNSGGAGGTVVNSRDGCLQDLSCPALTVTSNPVMILNASGLLKPPYTFWQEQNP